ncbi:MAG: NB-ARC domain-containing protein [Bacilli bacterium]|nr:NB-ARC domain-containing protein [Bacilli bacterium]
METNYVYKKIQMYVMISSIENDFINTYSKKLSYSDIPMEVINLSPVENKSKDNYLEILRYLDLQAYIVIANKNSLKLQVNSSEKKFLNSVFSKIIPIRNKVMHPRLLDFYDFTMLKSCFDSLPSQIKFIEWNNVSNALANILNNPSALEEYEYLLRKSDKTIENIPTNIDFEETSFIGRKKEIGEVREKLFKKNVHILSIVGDGGVGKTALVIKLLYDLLDDLVPQFDLILWTSLKTNELNKYEFKRIENAITSLAEMYGSLDKFIGGNSEKTTEEKLIELSSMFRTLLVLDNLETINTEEIKGFLDTFSENGKVIITSRIGLGEMEHRYSLTGMNNEDVMEYTEALFELYGLGNRFSSEELLKYVTNDFHSNPLSIKWVARSLYNGESIDKILRNKDNLVNFCMSNVYDKLSDDAKTLIHILKGLNHQLSYAELFYLVQESQEDDTKLRGAINDLISCNFLDQIKFKSNLLLSFTDFAKEFISSLQFNIKIDFNILNQKLAKLNAFEQDMLIKYNENKYSIGYFKINHNEKKKTVSAIYLRNALDAFQKNDTEKRDLFMRIAKKLGPKYFECNKVDALFYANSNPAKSREQFEIALENCEEEDIQSVLLHYSASLLKNNDYPTAYEKLLEAEKYGSNIYLNLEKVKILGCIGDFNQALEICNSILEEVLDNHNLNIALTRKADIYRRKAEREADFDKQYTLLKEATELLVHIKNQDENTLKYIGILLEQLSYFYSNESAVNFIFQTIVKCNEKLRRTSTYKKFALKFNENLKRMPNFEIKPKLIQYLINYDSEIEALKKNTAIIFRIKDNYGFLKNKDYPQGIYFNFKNVSFDCGLGDIVELGPVFSKEKGYIVYDLKLIKKGVSSL